MWLTAYYLVAINVLTKLNKGVILMINEKDNFMYFTQGVTSWRYKTLFHPEFKFPYFYAERKMINEGKDYYVNNHNLLLPADNPDGFRQNQNLKTFEIILTEHFEEMEKIKNESKIKKGKLGSFGRRSMFSFQIINEYKEAIIGANVTLSAYINEAIREKLINDGLLKELTDKHD